MEYQCNYCGRKYTKMHNCAEELKKLKGKGVACDAGEEQGSK